MHRASIWRAAALHDHGGISARLSCSCMASAETPNTWLFNQGRIAEHHLTFAFDLPGHGGSSKRVEQGSVEELADSVRCGLDRLELKRIHLVGHSMGAAVALALCEEQPERIASLSLIAPVRVRQPCRISAIYLISPQRNAVGTFNGALHSCSPTRRQSDARWLKQLRDTSD